jgi:hypothetical protein
MSNSMKGIISGFVATAVLSVLMLLKVQLQVIPEQYSLIAMLSRLAGGTPSAWADHFIIGVLVWGLLFGGFVTLLPKLPYWLTGLIFGVFAWLVAMIAFLPFVGSGLFGMKVGMMIPVIQLVQHLVYGLALGITFGLLTAWVPVKTPAGSPQV